MSLNKRIFMIYSNSLSNILKETLGLRNHADTLDRYVNENILTPQGLNINPISLNSIRSNQSTLKLVLANLPSIDITKKIDEVFIELFSKQDELLNKALIIQSKTSFLQTLVSTLIYGFILEIQELDQVKSSDFKFQLN